MNAIACPAATPLSCHQPHATSNATRLEDRVAAIERADLDFIDSELFRSREGQKQCGPVDELLLAEGSPAASPAKQAKGNHGSVHLARMCSVPLLTAEEEQALFRRMNYAKLRAAKLRGRLRGKEPQLELVEHIEETIEEARAIQNRLIQSNLRLVASLVKKFVNETNAFDELFSEGVVSLMRAVEKFDFSLGFRFSTYATQAIRRHLYRSVMGHQQERSRFVAADPLVIEEVEDDRTSVSFDEDRWSRRLAMLSEVLDQLDERERYIVERRFGLNEDRQVQTLQALAGELGVCKERVRQLQQRAIEKMTEYAQEFDVERLA